MIEEDHKDHNDELGSATDAAEVQAQATQPAPAETEAEPEAAAEQAAPEEAEAEPETDVLGSGSATAAVQDSQETERTMQDPAGLHETAASNPLKAPTDEEVYDSIKKQIAERGDAMVPEGATAHQYLVQLLRWAQDVGKLDTGSSPEASRLQALEREVATLKAKLAFHGMAIEE